MRSIGRGVLLGLAIAGLAAVLFQFAWTVYGILDNTPIDYIWGTLFILIVCAWVYYAKWLWGYWRGVRRERMLKKDRVRLAQGVAPLPQYPPNDMAALERDLQEGTLDNRPGSLGARAAGLELLDEALGLTEGDV